MTGGIGAPTGAAQIQWFRDSQALFHAYLGSASYSQKASHVKDTAHVCQAVQVAAEEALAIAGPNDAFGVTGLAIQAGSQLPAAGVYYSNPSAQ